MHHKAPVGIRNAGGSFVLYENQRSGAQGNKIPGISSARVGDPEIDEERPAIARYFQTGTW